MLINKIVVDGKVGNRIKESYIKNNYTEYYKDILEFSELNNYDGLTWSNKVYNYLFNISEIPTCVCGEKCSYRGRLNKVYNDYCSISCSAKDTAKDRHIKLKENLIQKHGVENVFQLESVKSKIRKTNLEKYGVDNPNKDKSIRNKIEKTNLKRYGSTSYLGTDECKIKTKKTNNDKYGVDFPGQSEIVKEKMRITCLEKYGVDNPNKDKSVRNKIEETNLKRYGCRNVSYSPIVVKKIKDSIKSYHKNDLFKIEEYKKRWDIDNLKYIGDSIFEYSCNVCGEKSNISYNLIYNRNKFSNDICLECNPLNSSSQQLEMNEYIKSLGVETEYNIMFDNKFEIDIFIPVLNLGFEFNGIWWHSEKYKEKNYHLNKKFYFKDKDIDVVQIWEDDWKLKKDIVKSIIRNKLLKNINKIYARKCDIRIVNNKESYEFYVNNHLQGGVYSKINIGLYNNNELVSLMSFDKRKITSKLNFELTRFCNVLNTTIIGSASKLFSYFLKTYDFEEVISYSDNSISNGNIYKSLNFIDMKTNTINYYWCDGVKKYHRFNFNKKRLVKQGFDPNKSESKIMYERGYYRIWGCGNNKWIYKK